MVISIKRLLASVILAIPMLTFLTTGQAREALLIPTEIQGDEFLSCAALDSEIEGLHWKTFGLYMEMDQSTRGNVAFLALAILSPVTLVGLTSTDTATKELISYRQRYDRLVKLHQAGTCPSVVEKFPTADDMERAREADKKISNATRLGKIKAYAGKWVGASKPAVSPSSNFTATNSINEACPALKFKIRVRNQYLSGFASDGKGRRIGVEGTVRMNGRLWEAVLGTAPLNGSLWEGTYHMPGCIREYQWQKIE